MGFGHNRKVKYTGRDDLTSWALHKHPEDIEIHDYRDYSILDADVVIHREGGVNKIVKGADVGRIFSDEELFVMEQDATDDFEIEEGEEEWEEEGEDEDWEEEGEDWDEEEDDDEDW